MSKNVKNRQKTSKMAKRGRTKYRVIRAGNFHFCHFCQISARGSMRFKYGKVQKRSILYHGRGGSKGCTDFAQKRQNVTIFMIFFDFFDIFSIFDEIFSVFYVS